MRVWQNRPKYILTVLIIAVLLAVAALYFFCKHGPLLPGPAKGYKWQQVFDDEFNTNSLNNHKWVTCYDWYDGPYNGCTNGGNQELEWYMPGQVSVANGSATLSAVAKQAYGWAGSYQQTYYYRSGMISTGRPNLAASPKSTYAYGYFEARIKTTSGKGIWPAFWLLPANKKWPPEIDAMEILGDKPSNVLMTYHWGANAASHQKDSTTFTNLTDPNSWHTYAVNWQPGRIDWYIDGQLRKTVTSANVPDTPMEVIASLAVGGNLPGNPTPATHFPASMKIDYIRIYQQIKS